jgi:hypothetical protein
MDAAEKTWDGLVTPALAAYDDRLQRAHERYATALGQAESTHRQLLADAQRAQADGRTISGVA